jgi:ParB-like chromosome segregation protein Spo0J
MPEKPAEQKAVNTTPAETQMRVTEKVKKKGKKAVDKKNKALETLNIEYIHVNDIHPNEWNPNRQSDHDFELLLKSMSEDGFCVAAHTPILCADLKWRPAGDLLPGDKIIAFDRDAAALNENGKHQRRFKTTTVTSNGIFEDDLYEVSVEGGHSVLCNAEHPWLCSRKYGPVEDRFNGEWVRTSELTNNDYVFKILDTWETVEDYSSGWLSGFLDGEGCLSLEKTHNGSNHPVARLSVTQKPSKTADKMVKEVLERCPEAEVSVWEHVDQPNWQDNVRVRVNRMGSIMKLIGSVQPQRLIDNAGYFWEGRSIIPKDGARRRVVSVNHIGKGKLASLGTESRTYIASGFAMHNTQPVVCIKTEDGRIKIVDGEHRWRAAHSLGFDEIPVVITPMTEEQAKIATLRHNRARGSEDIDLTAELLRDLEKVGALDWAQDSLMLDDAELNKLLEDIAAPDALAGEDWTEAWEPSNDRDVEDDDELETTTETREIQSGGGGTVAAASSIAAVERQREREKQLAQAKTAEERQALRKDHDIFRLYLTFTGDEATLVKQVLGDHAAEKVIEMCKKEEQSAEE